MNQSISRIMTLTRRNIKEIFRDPISLVFIIGLPLVMEILFYFMFASLTSQFEMRYLAPGIVVFSQSFLSLFLGLLISIDKSTSFTTRLFVSKAKSYEFILSYVFSLIPFVLIQSILFFAIGVICDSSILKIEILYCILLSLVTSIFFLGIGVLIGSLCSERSVGGIASIIISAQSLLSGMWFPIEGLDGVMVKIMNILPFKNATMLMQNTLNGYESVFKDLITPLVIVVVYSAIILLLSIFVYKNKMKSK